MLKTISV